MKRQLIPLLLLIKISDNNNNRVPFHLCEGFLGHSKDVRVEVAHGVTPIGRDCIGAIDGQLLVGVDGHEDNAWQLQYPITPQLLTLHIFSHDGVE